MHPRRIPSLGLAALTFVLLLALLGKSQAQSLAIRKNVRNMTTVERTVFVNAVKAMKTRPSFYDPTAPNAYDYFVQLHLNAFLEHESMAHMAPPFFPFHRELLRRFEVELVKANNNQPITLPYWDWTDPVSTPLIFSTSFMGGDGDPNQDYAVTTGPFRKGQWPITIRNASQIDPEADAPYLQRALGANPLTPTLPIASSVQQGLNMTKYDAPPYDVTNEDDTFRIHLEGFRGRTNPNTGDPIGTELHGRVHLWVGGQMGSGASPNDPVFFLHHANLDRIWAEWEDLHYNLPPDDFFPYLFAHEELFGFAGVRNGDQLSVRRLGYRYDTQANTAPASPNLSGQITLLEAVQSAQQVTFTFQPNSGNAFSCKTMLTPEGTYTLYNVPAGTYSVAIKGEKWLQRVFALTVSTRDLTNVDASLVPGDANNDNQVDIFDLGTLAEDFNSGPADVTWNGGRSDFNCDSSVDIFDLAVLAAYFNTAGDL